MTSEAPATPDTGPADDIRSVTQRTADEIRERIKYGRLAPGQRLIESDLLTQLSVGRNTIRAAFSQLATEGIITLERNRGAHVRVLDLEGIRQLYELRATLEGRAAGLAAERVAQPGCREAMDELDRLNEGFLEGGAFSDYWRYNETLHRTVLTYCGNPMLQKMAEQTRTLTYHYHLQASAQGDSSHPVSIGFACAQHHAILSAIIRGDAEAAEAHMREHIKDNGVSIVKFMSNASE